MNVSVHINFNEQCQEAFEYYAETLGGKIGTMLQFKDSPASTQVAAGRQNKIVHGNIFLDGVELAGADVDAAQYEAPKGFYILLGVSGMEKVETIFNRFAEGGTVILPPQQTFWSPCYAIITDRFGVPWKINCAN